MRKKFILCMILISFLLCVNFYTLNVSATSVPVSVPVPTSGTLDFLSDGGDKFFNNFYSYFGLYPDDFSMFEFGSNLNTTVSIDDIDIYPITESDLTELGYNSNSFYTSGGEVYSLSDVFVCESDNGYFKSRFYLDLNGNLLFNSDGGELVAFKVSDNDSFGYNALYADLVDQIVNNDLVLVNDPDINGSDLSFTIFYGENSASYGYPAFFLSIPNQYNQGVICAIPLEGFVRYWYFNDYDSFTYKRIRGYTKDAIRVLDGNYTYNGYSYSHCLQLNYGGWTGAKWNATPNESYMDFVNGAYGGDNLFAYSGNVYNANLLNNVKSKGFRVLDYAYDVPAFDVTKYYTVDQMDSFANAVSDGITYNPDYDYQQPISSTNYPTVSAVEDTVISGSIAFPEVIDGSLVVPESIPTDNFIPSEQIENMNIPIISNLQYRFPFSIPFDIYNLLNGLSVSREIPHFEFTLSFPVINYEWNIVLDLTMWDDIATLFRVLFLILFIIGLAIFSYSHFFGS